MGRAAFPLKNAVPVILYFSIPSLFSLYFLMFQSCKAHFYFGVFSVSFFAGSCL